MDTLFSPETKIDRIKMDHHQMQWWLDKALDEVKDWEKYTNTVQGYIDFIAEMTAEQDLETPAVVEMFNEFLSRFAPEDMVVSIPTLAVCNSFMTKPQEAQMIAWSFVIESLKKGSTLSLRDLRPGLSPSSIPSPVGMAHFWKMQKVERDPVTRSDNWLDRAEAWTLEGLAKRNAELQCEQ